jgi:hypothetical protein
MATGKGSVSYSIGGLPQGSYVIEGKDVVSGKTVTESFNKAVASPTLEFIKTCSSYKYNASRSCTTEAEIITANNSLSASLYVNDRLVGVTNTTISDTESAPGNYTYVFQTNGNSYYNSKSITYTGSRSNTFIAPTILVLLIGIATAVVYNSTKAGAKKRKK